MAETYFPQEIDIVNTERMRGDRDSSILWAVLLIFPLVLLGGWWLVDSYQANVLTSTNSQRSNNDLQFGVGGAPFDIPVVSPSIFQIR